MVIPRQWSHDDGRFPPLPPAFPLLALAVPVPVAAQDSAGFFRDAEPYLDLRYRHEQVEQANALRDARAHTLRTRVGLRSGQWHGFSAVLEVDNVARLGSARYNDTRNGRSGHAVIADPQGTHINQALLRFQRPQFELGLGRQRINLGNQRFVGGVAWRQNEQTFDGVSMQVSPRQGLDLRYAWLGQVNTIFGPDDGVHASRANPSRIDGDSHLFDLRYALTPNTRAGAYHYRLDLENLALNAAAPPGTLSSITSGLRLDGTLESLGWVLEYAQQKEASGNPWQLDSHYRLIELAYPLGKAQLKAGQEILGGGDGPGNRAFQTPLATKHPFQGWADMFGTTPADGIEDRYLGVVLPLGGGNLQAVFHDFRPERGSGSYGDELDFSWGRAIPQVKGLSTLLKFARYRSDDPARSVDTDKWWLQLQYSY